MVALRVHDGLTEDPVEGDWIRRFRRASGLPVGGWGVLREHPALEAALASELLERHSLDFYVANAEAEYGFTGPDGVGEERFGRSRAFVDAFRRLQPTFREGSRRTAGPISTTSTGRRGGMGASCSFLRHT